MQDEHDISCGIWLNSDFAVYSEEQGPLLGRPLMTDDLSPYSWLGY